MSREINFTGQAPLYFAPFEVALHNQSEDCWVSLFGRVLNITDLIAAYCNDIRSKPLLAFAGKDISDWFDPTTKDIQMHIHPVTGLRVPYTPHGIIPDVEVKVPTDDLQPYIPWWKNRAYVVGKLTERVRPIRIINPGCLLETHLNVCAEDSILRIKERYSIFNSNCNEYIWRFGDNVLADGATLEENGVIDERDVMASVGMDPNFYIPALMIYANDHLQWVQVSSSDEDDDEFGNYYLDKLCTSNGKI